MKKQFFLGICMSLSVLGFSQITDENGVSATGVFNQVLTGKIGVGTSTPTTTLEINGTTTSKRYDVSIDESYSTDFFKMESINTPLRFIYYASGISSGMYHNDRNNKRRFEWSVRDDNQAWLRLKNKNGGEAITLVASNTTYGDYIQMPSSNSRVVIGGNADYLYNEGHKFVVKNGSAMIEGDILTNNKIGIGTSSFTDGNDTYHLSVNGKVRAHGVKVYTGWADYVFEEDYNLPTLEEVEQHINEKGHLKDIPSAEEVEEDGIELGEMNKLLLQKIEELTLYTIQLKKEIDQLKSKN